MQELERSPFLGALFEGFVASEIVKAQSNTGRRPEVYWFRDKHGLEVDFLVPSHASTTLLVEAKATRTPTPAMSKPMLQVASALREKRRGKVRAAVVHRPVPTGPTSRALAPGVDAVADREIADWIG